MRTRQRAGRQERLLLVAMLVVVIASLVVIGARRAAAGSPSLTVLRATGSLVRPVSAWPQAGHDARRSSHVAAGVAGPTSGRQRWQRSLGVPCPPVR